MSSLVLHYGPYSTNGIIRHKTQRLRSVIRCLTHLEFEIELIPSTYFERVTVEMKGREIFRCNIMSLLFNVECADDPICQKLVSAAKEAEKRLCSENNIPKYHSVVKGKRLIEEIKKAKTTQQLLSSDIKLWYEIPKQATETKK